MRKSTKAKKVSLLALREHLATGQPLTELEAIILYGAPNVPKAVSTLRRQGWTIDSQQIPYVKALRRLNKQCTSRRRKTYLFEKFKSSNIDGAMNPGQKNERLFPAWLRLPRSPSLLRQIRTA